nr:hypothetical protein [Chlamydiota bacterium]
MYWIFRHLSSLLIIGSLAMAPFVVSNAEAAYKPNETEIAGISVYYGRGYHRPYRRHYSRGYPGRYYGYPRHYRRGYYGSRYRHHGYYNPDYYYYGRPGG